MYSFFHLVCLCCCVSPRPYITYTVLHSPLARCSLFVLKVPLNTNKPNQCHSQWGRPPFRCHGPWVDRHVSDPWVWDLLFRNVNRMGRRTLEVVVHCYDRQPPAEVWRVPLASSTASANTVNPHGQQINC